MKQIQWFPGHMTKALSEIKERLGLVDMVMELLDARAPKACENPELHQMIDNKPRLVLLTKADLADPKATQRWIQWYEKQGIKAIAIDANRLDRAKMIRVCEALLREKMEKEQAKGLRPRPIRAMICGIPNVGKSTLINRLALRKAAQVGNRPGVTKAQQWIKVEQQFELLDTPGVLWPRFEDKEVGIHLALLGTIKREILPLSELIYELLSRLTTIYPGALAKRYHIEETPISSIEAVEDLLKQIGKARGMLVKGGEVDLEKTQDIILKEFADGILGKMTLEQVGV